MPSRSPNRTILGLAAGVTVTSLLGATLAVPAAAGPVDRDNADLAKRKIGVKEPLKAAPNKWLVQVSGQPSLRGGSRSTAKSRQAGVRDAASDAGVKYSVLRSYTRVWNGFSVKASQANAEKLRALRGVTAVYPVFTVKLPDDSAEPDLKYSLPMIGADVAQVSGFRGDGVKVGVIDTGIDYNHPDLLGSGTPGNDGDFPGPKVKYGYDFVGDDYDSEDPANADPDPDSLPDDCNGHGTHVAGIIGANGGDEPGHATGVAPNVELGAYRVFGCEGSADTEVILAAMDRAAADGMDVINMSLGDAFQTWPDYPDAAAASALVAAGTIVVTSAGNSGTSGLFSSGAPGVGKDVISVASVENTTATNRVFSVSPVPPSIDEDIAYVPAEGAPQPPASGSAQLANADPLNGCDDITGVSGNFALIERGDCTFYDKAANAQAAGATGVVIYNNEPGLLNPTVVPEDEEDPPITIPVVFISQEDGAALQTQLTSTPTTLTWTTGTEASANPYSGTVSDFSSFGMAADLTLTPDVAAPGGNIWSTYPLEQKGYANLSGTSMASPHVAGSVALMIQGARLKGIDLNHNQPLVRAALTNTSVPIDKLLIGTEVLDGFYEPTVRQGAGLIQVDKAIQAATASTSVTPGKLSLGENRTSYYKTTLKLTNRGTSSETYKLSLVNSVNAGPDPTTHWYNYDTRNVSAKFSPSTVTVKAGKTASVSVSIKQPSKLDEGWIYGGWVKLTRSDKAKTLVVPFAGMWGDYQKVKVLQDYIDVNEDGTDLETVAELPALGYLDGEDVGLLYADDPKRTFTLVDDDDPLVVFHFDYPVADAVFNVYKATSTGKKGAEVFSGYKTFFELGKTGRDDSFQYVPFEGKIPFNPATSAGLTVPDGDYVLEIRVLKALGSAGASSHWETFVTPAFTIDRPEG